MALELGKNLAAKNTVLPATRWSWPIRYRRYSAEGIGVFAIVFAAGGTTITGQTWGGQSGLVGAALASGLTVMAMIYALGHICGAHFNPAVTLAFTVARHFPIREVPGYIASQLLGATLAAATLRGLFGNVAHLGATLPAGSPVQSLLLEGIISFFLMFVIIAVATDSRAVGQAAALAIGVTVTVAILIAGPVSGASMNPARSFGPALVSGTWQDHWIYWLGPAVGTTLGAITYKFLQDEKGSYRHER
jgi:MIP family channel proteins